MKKLVTILIIGGLFLSCGLKQDEATESKPEIAIEQQRPDKPKPHKSAIVEIDGAVAEIHVFGWSEDARYFAFADRGNRADPLDIENQGYGEFRLVEVAKDEFVEEVTTSVTYTEAEPVTREEIDAVQNKFLEKVKPYGIKGETGTELAKKVIEDTGETERVEFTTDDGRTFIATLREEIRYDEYPCEGRFELVLVNEKSGRKVTLQKMGRFFLGRKGYSIHSAYADPSGKWIAVFTLKTIYGFEGSGIPEFMVNTGHLP